MPPHNDAPSPPGSYRQRGVSLTLGHHPLSAFGAVQSPGHSPFYSDSLDSPRSDLRSEAMHRPLVPGVYVPTLAFFESHTEDLDLDTTAKHAVRLAQAGVAGITTQGSNGEAVHLSHHERMVVTRTTRHALDEAGFNTLPIIVGCGAQSTREAIDLCREANYSGGDYALVLPPSYYKSLFDTKSVFEFFQDVASESPIPILIYNYPGAVSGMDLDSDTIIRLSAHPNIVGCKLTCGNTGKLARIAAATSAATPSDPGSGFMCLGGSADFTLQTMVVGGSGTIGGLANLTPKACVQIIDLFEAGNIKDARRLQAIVARGDWAAIQGGIVGTKSAMQTYLGYGGHARKPLPRPTTQEAEQYARGFKELVALEKSL